jgi:hypothetical protein
MSSIKIAVVGDGPIGNLVIAKLLIEHHKNKNEDSKEISITHHTSERVSTSGYTRRHILFITDKLVKVLEENVLKCVKCLYNAANNQKLTEDYQDREKLLFSTRVLENILLNHINTNKDNYCNAPKCTFTTNVNNDKNDTFDYYKYDYVFFAIGSNSTQVRKKYLYDGINNNTIKIIANETEPIVTFYSNLGNVKSSPSMFDEDKQSLITSVNKDQLLQAGIDIYELDIFANIIYAFHDRFYAFIKILDEAEKRTILDNSLIKELYSKRNLSLEGYLNFNDYLYKFTLAINTMQYLFKNHELYHKYIQYIKDANIRVHQINDISLNIYNNIINNDVSINNLLLNYSRLIIKLLNNISQIDSKTCTLNTDKSISANNCFSRTFLVNIVQQSLNSYGIINYNKLAYANQQHNTKFFMIGDMANAFTPGISVEIGINFVNYIIPMFYKFYMTDDKTILQCNELNIVDILNELLSDRYQNLLNRKINNGNNDTELTLKKLIEYIRNNYRDNLKELCDDNDIFLTYYNIVLLIQYIKNVDLILQNKQIIAISEVFDPDNYNIIDSNLEKKFRSYF